MPPLENCCAKDTAVLYLIVVEPNDGNVIISPILNRHFVPSIRPLFLDLYILIPVYKISTLGTL